MSEETKNAKIVQVTKTELKTSKTPKNNILKWAISCLCVAIIVMISILLSVALKPTDTTSASNLTSYILEINPSVCITTDKNNMVISVFSLNNDADILLSDEKLNLNNEISIDNYVKEIINLSIEKGFLFSSNSQTEIAIYAINNKESHAKENSLHIKEIIGKELLDQGFENFNINSNTIKIDEFKEKTGIESNNKDLDKMQNDLLNHDKFFDPNFDPANPPSQNKANKQYFLYKFL